ncbi:MAG: hypothetical protein P8M73_02295 [Luminiphilus sp.]|nr:hypothetical protein [Luminiphilus sp.]
MRSLIAIAALVASASVNAGELDGKWIRCEPYSDTYWFADGEAIEWSLLHIPHIAARALQAKRKRADPAALSRFATG